MELCKKKPWLIGLVLIGVIFNLFWTTTAHADEKTDSGSHLLSFEVDRPEASNYETIFGTYGNYWYWFPEWNVYDRDKGHLKDFNVDFELHLPNSQQTITKRMVYTEKGYNWNGTIQFTNIPISSDRVSVEYYTKDDGARIEPYLLHYDLYLEQGANGLVLRVPELMLRDDYSQPLTGNEHILEVNNLKINELSIYLNGQSGSDDNDGSSPEKALKTFEKAHSLASTNKNIRKIIVTGTTNISGEVSLAGTNAQIIRDKQFTKELFRLAEGKTARLSDIVIDGNYPNNQSIEKALICTLDGSKLTIDNGTVLKNNYQRNIPNNTTTGGAIDARRSQINMIGGVIEGNQATYGGGVYLGKSKMLFSGGVIQNNRSNRVNDYSVSPTQYYSAGGGILANDGSEIILSGEAQILNNVAAEIGGGISLGSNQWGAANILQMNGGTIDGNTAGATGGGIFIQAKYFSGGASEAHINAGYITNNVMDNSGVTESMFGGGGIYVNGATPQYGGNGILYLKNAVITNNQSVYEGAGYAACPISKTKIFVTDGAAIYGNNVTSAKSELYILCNKYLGLHGGDPEYELSERMLGGVPYSWITDKGTPLDPKEYRGVLTVNNSYLALHTEAEGNELTQRFAKVIISGNRSATRGGGIGSNGTVIIGKDNKTEIKVHKKWVFDTENTPVAPKSVTVNLFADNIKIDSAVLSAENNWEVIFAELPTENNGQPISYTISEDPVDGYTSSITGSPEEGFTITNSNVPTPKPERINIFGSKIWNDDKNAAGTRPENITIRLYANNIEVAHKTISAQDNWTWSFIDLPKNENGQPISYTISEDPVDGYTSSITGSPEEGFTITNSNVPTPKPGLPQVSDSNIFYPPFMTLLGSYLLFVHTLLRHK